MHYLDLEVGGFMSDLIIEEIENEKG